MAKSINLVQVTDTFQTWFNKTNEIVTLINGDVMTASPGTDVTIGNARLQGNFTANNVTANTQNGLFSGFGAKVSSISQQTGNTSPISVGSSLSINATQTAITATHTSGPRIRFSNSSRNWDIGHGSGTSNSSFSFICNGTLVGTITPDGSLEMLGGATFAGNVALGQATLLGGNVSQPGLRWTNEPSSGIYRVSENVIGVSIGGTQRLSISNTTIVANTIILASNGSSASPGYSFSSQSGTGMFAGATYLGLGVGGSNNIIMDVSGNIKLYGNSSIQLRTYTSSSLDIDANSTTGIRIGRNSLYSALTILKPNTTQAMVQTFVDSSISANGGYVHSWQGANISRPTFAFIGDTTTGIGKSQLIANSVAVVTSGVTQMTVSPNGIGIRGGAGIQLDSFISASQGDPSSHLSLYGNTYGFSVTGGTLNIIAPSTGKYNFTSANTNDTIVTIIANGGNGIIRAGNGSSNTPSFSFISSPNTGLWRFGVGVLGVVANGIERARFGTISQFFGTVQANTFNLVDVSGGGFLGVSTDTEEAPSYTWTGDIDTGMWRYGSNAIGFTTGASNRIVINASGVTLQNESRFIAANRGTPAFPDYTFSGASNYGMYYVDDSIRFAANGSSILTANTELMILQIPLKVVGGNSVNPGITWGNNPSTGFHSTNSFMYATISGDSSHRFDTNGALGLSIMTRDLGDARYQRTSSRRFKDKLTIASNSTENRLLNAFDLFNIKTWNWGKELSKHDERYGTEGIGLVVEELEEFLPEAVRYQWIEEKNVTENVKPTKKRALALDDSPIIASLILKIRQLEARINAMGV